MSTLMEQLMNHDPNEGRDDNPVTVRDTGLFTSGETQDNLLLLDGDTFTGLDGTKYRLQGAYAPEIEQIDPAHGKTQIAGVDVPFTSQWTTNLKAAEYGGPETTTAVASFMERAKNDGNAFDVVVKTGETDAYGREVVRLTNREGKDLTEELYRNGIYKPTPATDKAYVNLYTQGERARQLGTFEGYTEVLDEFNNDLQAGLMMDPLTGLPVYKKVAVDEAEYAAGKAYGGLYSDVAFRDPNKTIDNMATNSIGSSAYTGWLGMVDGAYGFLELVGDSVADKNAEEENWFQKTGKDNRESLRLMMEDLPQIENFHWDEVDGVLDGIQYLGNNMAASSPYLALIAGSTLATGGIGLAGTTAAVASGIPSAVVYSGQIYNEMEGEKNAGAAIAGGIAAATLDRLGLGSVSGGSARMFTKEGVEALAKEMVAMGKASSLPAAREALKNATKQSAAEYFRSAGKAAIEQSEAYLRRTNLLKETAQGIGFGAVGEGLTEAGQETIQYVTATQWSDKQFNQFELEDRIRDALIAGASLGGGLGGAGGINTHANNVMTRNQFAEAHHKYLNEVEAINRSLREGGTYIPGVEEVIESTQKAVASDQRYADAELQAEDKAKKRRGKKKESKRGSFNERAQRHQKDHRGFFNTIQNIESIPDAIAKSIAGANRLVVGAATVFNELGLTNEGYGETLRNVRALIGQVRGTINHGRSFEAAQDFLYSTIAQQVYLPEVMARFNLSKVAKSGDREAITKMLREYGKDGWFDRALNGESLADAPAHIRQNKDALLATAKELQSMGDSIWQAQDRANREDGGEGVSYIDGWWWKHQDFDPRKVQKYKKEWMQFMRENAPDMTEQEILEFYDRITSGDTGTVEDFFSHVRGIEFQPGSHKHRSANLSEQEGFNMFARDDMFDTLDVSAKQAARYATNRRYFGAGGKNLDYLFDKLEEEGMPRDQVDRLAWHAKAIVDSAGGNYNRIKNPTWASVQKFATTWSIFAGLPLAALSSLPESVMINIGLREGEVPKALGQAAKQVAGAIVENFTLDFDKSIENGEWVPVDESGKPLQMTVEQAKLNKAGLLWSPQSVIQRLGVGETNIAYSWYQDMFFKASQITAVTQGQRRAAAAIHTDFVASRLAELAAAGDLSKGLTNSQQQAYVQLSETGMNVEQMVEIWKDFGNNTKVLDYVGEKREIPADIMSIIDDNMQTSLYSFVNLRVQNPGAANRPLFFQDPHYAMLTQFNGFISTFTANVVPKLWKDYLTRGAPQMKYDTFKLMLMMVAMGGVSQYLKDYLKYGRSTPYLEPEELIQRALYSAGIFGQYERIIDSVVPLYDMNSGYKNTFETILSMAVGESGPTVRNIGLIGGAIGDISEGETEKAAHGVSKVTPVLAPFKGVTRGIVEFIHGDDFGEGYDYYDKL